MIATLYFFQFLNFDAFHFNQLIVLDKVLQQSLDAIFLLVGYIRFTCMQIRDIANK